MQTLDYWLGVPICWLLSCFERLLRLFKPAKKITPRRTVFVELSEMGSAILAYSSLLKFRELFPESELFFLTFKRNKDTVSILEMFPETNIITIDDVSLPLFIFSFIRVLWWMHKTKIDTVIDLELFSRCTAVISYLSGASNRVGFHRYTYEGVYRGDFLTHGVPYNDQQHITSCFMDMMLSLKADPKEVPHVKRPVNDEHLSFTVPRFAPTETDIAGANALLKRVSPELTSRTPLILINPDPGVLPLRGWPVTHYKQLCEQLLAEHPGAFVGVIGLSRSKIFYQELSLELNNDRLFDLTGKTKNIRELLSLLQVSSLLVSSDSGIPHLAAMTALPSIVLFGPETPVRYAPLHKQQKIFYARYSCSPCLSAFNHRQSKCSSNKCMQAITPAEVYQEVIKYISPSPAYRLAVME